MKHVILVAMCIVCFGCRSQQQTTAVSKSVSNVETPMNILFIAVDDLKPLLSNYGNSEMHTPNFDRLAKMGTSFTNAHVQYAVCGPSRASVMTATFPDRTKVWDLQTDFRKSAPDLISMPEYLISKGYQTTGVGKIYHKGSSSPGHDGKSWSIPHQLPEPKGDAVFSLYQDPRTKEKMNALMVEAKGKNVRQYVLNKLKPSTENADVPDDHYQDGIYALMAIEQMKVMMQNGKPWFEAVGFQRPHLPFNAPKKYWDLYDRDKIELAKYQDLSEGTPLFAYHNFGELRSYTDIPNNMKIGDRLPEAKQKELIHGYMASISYVDAQLGKLMDFLEENGQLDKTVIVLWGDHGFHLGDHTEWCKHSNFEQATRIPFMFAAPGVVKNNYVDRPVNLVDLFPTIFELVGIEIPAQAEGKSLVGLMDDDPKTNIEAKFAVHQYKRGSRMGYAIRTERFRYTEWHDNNYRSYDPYKDDNIVGRELYDYDTDPLETKNLIDQASYKEMAQTLKNILKSHLEEQYKKYKQY